MTAFRSLSLAMLKGFFREKVTVFFTFIFPLMFLLIFGLLFRDDGANKVEIAVVGDGPVISALPADVLQTVRYETFDEAVEAVRDGDVPAAISEDGGTVTVRFAASDQTIAGIVDGVVSSVVDGVNLAATGQPPSVTLEASQVEDSSLKAIQYIAPGLLSWSIAMSAAIGSSAPLVSWRKRQVLRRIRLAPINPMSVLGARLGVTIVIAFVQALFFIGISLTPMFGLQLVGQWWLAIPLLALGTLAFFAIGMLAGAFSKTEEGAAAASNLIVLPMAFLSGTFFPIDQAPQWLQTVSNLLPLRHFNDGMLDVMVRGQGIEALLVPGAVMIGFAAVFGVLAMLLFKWED